MALKRIVSLIDAVSNILKTTQTTTAGSSDSTTPNKDASPLTFRVVGIRRHPSNHADHRTFALTDISVDILCVPSHLTAHDTVLQLQQFLKHSFGIAPQYDMLILYSHHIVSANPQATLAQFGITNNSLLMLAISAHQRTPSLPPHPLPSAHCFQTSAKGFDIIMQEADVEVHAMPVCGHAMNKLSFFDYAMSHFKERHNTHLTCPHDGTSSDGDEKADSDGSPSPYCCAQWDYASVKPLIVQCFERTTPVDGRYGDDAKEQTDREVLMRLYYENRLTYFRAKRDNKLVSMQFQEEYWAIRKRLAEEHGIKYKALKSVRMTAEKKVKAEQHMQGDVTRYTTQLELLSARNTMEKDFALKRCPKCATVHYRLEEEKGCEADECYEAKCAACEDVVFCWNCGKEWIGLHVCDARFVRQLEEILASAEKKKIGQVTDVPSVRCCPKCAQLIFHTEACKHMDCSRCKTRFCFVCMKLNNRGWQCGSSGDRCPVAPVQCAKDKTLPDVSDIYQKAFQLF